MLDKVMLEEVMFRGISTEEQLDQMINIRIQNQDNNINGFSNN